MAADEISEKTEQVQPTPPVPRATSAAKVRGLDVPALSIVIIIAASFAVTARFNDQPSSSLTPVAVLSATGCGLLVTALRKLRTTQRPGLLEAGLGGFILALFQFLAAISYPGVLSTLGLDEGQRQGFLATWALIALFSIIFAMAGAALGHLAFAPLRPVPRAGSSPQRASTGIPTPTPAATGHSLTRAASPLHSFINDSITVLLLGLAPTLVGIVFAAAFNYMLGTYQFTPGPYPTLRLLSTMLAWQIPIHLNLSGSNLNSIVLLLWRIPLFVGNPTTFDVQALEPLVFHGAALGLLLLTMHGRNSSLPLSWPAYLVFEATQGLFLVLPADLWMLGGLHGLLQIPRMDVVLPIATLHLLDQRLFVLNLITGPLVCLGMGLLLRESKRTRAKKRDNQRDGTSSGGF